MPSEFFDVVEIADHVFAAIAKPGSGAGSNAGIVDLGDGALVFDTMMTPQAGEALRRTAEELTGQEVRFVVLSHRDYDHVFGAQSFPRAAVIATATTDRVMRRRVASVVESSPAECKEIVDDMKRQVAQAHTPALRRERAGFLADFEALMGVHEQLAPHYPDLLYERSLTVSGPRRRVELHSFGAVHTESDSVGFLPAEGILFAGDIVQVGNHPAIRCGLPEEWDAVLAPIASLGARIVVSGHGPVGDPEAISLMRAYLAQLPAMAQTGALVHPFLHWAANDVWHQNMRYLEQRQASR